MDEAKRRTTQKSFTREYSKIDKDAKPVMSWLQFDQDRASSFVAITTRGAWTGISTLILFWIIVRFIGPTANWWRLGDMT
uniref:Uncharacterized protein n=1 Tax=Paulinella micropora TaxID=1928728 RepID=A0A385I0R8_9EUKA|nr:hypothetical protein PMNZ_593 [Paulinella micropora]AXY63527.1 hypothetical protein PMNZ_593 [Paulinella micropora]